ncbi:MULTISPECIES: hypothetical protein [Saccharothrix]|uniref:hypothetical protein n=1 Tax=Saccharothrix TaxID=2071 RepID=UPI00093A374A|nr:hypothetical protein [Saccharothrix sp. CB00851]OKI24940.1 hypothetical protein A6A25_33625 [Saccharothrix sp. CB00851]
MKRRAESGSNLVGVVGWIFADSLLVLVVIFLATQTGGAVSTPTTSTKTTTTTTTSTPPPGVDSAFICFRVTADPTLLTGRASPERDAHLKAVEDQVVARLSQPDLNGRRAGVVLSFGVADQPTSGADRAKAFNAEILPRLGAFSHRDDGGLVASRAFWGGNPKEGKPDGSITVNVYPMIEGRHGPLNTVPVEDC